MAKPALKLCDAPAAYGTYKVVSVFKASSFAKLLEVCESHKTAHALER